MPRKPSVRHITPVVRLIVATAIGVLAVWAWYARQEPRDWPAMDPPPAVDLAPPDAPLLDLGSILFRAAHAAPPPPQELDRALVDLSAGRFADAYAVCARVGTERDRPPTVRGPALVCATRAALGLQWTPAAISLGTQAVIVEDGPAAHLALGDAYRVSGACPAARPHFLRVLEVDEHNGDAISGLRACAVDLPPPASTPRRRPRRRATIRAKVRVRRCAWVWTGCTGRATTTATGKSETAPACESCAARMAGEHGHSLRGIMDALRRDPSLLRALRSILGVSHG